jgi:hypothetical protein
MSDDPPLDTNAGFQTLTNQQGREAGADQLRAALDTAGTHRKGRQAAPRFQLVPFQDLRPTTDSEYLIKGLLPRVGVALVWGPPKSGKSFLVTDMMLHVALGWAYRDRKVVQGSVVYCAFEGASGYGKRAEAFRRRYGLIPDRNVPFFLVPARMDFIKDHKALIAAIRAACVSPLAITLDTLNRSLRGSESKDEDMAAYVRAADALREAFNCLVLIVHHCGVDGSRPRGHTSLTGAIDAQLAVKRDAAGNLILTVEWLKDGEEGDTIPSRLEAVQVAIDDDGGAVTSCVVVPIETSQVAPARRALKLKAREELARRSLSTLIAEAGTAPPLDLPVGVRAVTRDTWRDRCYRQGFCADEKLNTRRQAFGRVVDRLQVNGIVAVRDDWVWLVQNDSHDTAPKR